MDRNQIPERDRNRLRQLASRQAELAALPVMEERSRLWRAHNSLQSDRPVIIVEMDTFEAEMIPALECSSGTAREMERKLLRAILHEELIGDDVVVPSCFDVERVFDIHEFGMDIRTIHALDSEGRDLGYAWEHPIRDLIADIGKLGKTCQVYDDRSSEAHFSDAFETFGDILPVRFVNNSLRWHFAPAAKVVALMGLESMMINLLDHPEEMRTLFNFITADMLSLLDRQTSSSLLSLNNGNDYVGAGSYGFTGELPGPDFLAGGQVRSTDLWGNINSQESVGISPDMFEEFIFPSSVELAKRFGLVYYGCCEPVHPIWDRCLSRLPGLRKVSVSAWCDEEFMGRALAGSKVIYSRKPSPNFLGVGKEFDELGFTQHLERTLSAAHGCTLEMIFRDVYTLSGDPTKPGRAVRIVRDLIDKHWK